MNISELQKKLILSKKNLGSTNNVENTTANGISEAITNTNLKKNVSFEVIELLNNKYIEKFKNIETKNQNHDEKIKKLEENNNISTQEIYNLKKLCSDNNSKIISLNEKISEQNDEINEQNDKINNIHYQEYDVINTKNSNIQDIEDIEDILPIKTINQEKFVKLKKAASQIYYVLYGSYYVGSGWFYYDNTDDLKSGFFITGAHFIIQIQNQSYRKISQAFILNPITGFWTDINVNNIYIDGIANIALIKTGIDFTENEDFCLKISKEDPKLGDLCYVIGHSNICNEQIISVGNVCNPNYSDSEGMQITDSISVNFFGFGGSSGGPIVNVNGDVIGINTFSYGELMENFGGGSNRTTLIKTLQILKSGKDNKEKRFLGIDWSIPNPFQIKNNCNSNKIKSCVLINNISMYSPFKGLLDVGDLLLGATLPNKQKIEFGNNFNQQTPGILIYYYDPITIEIKYIKANENEINSNLVTLDKSYQDVTNIYDGPLQVGFKNPKNNKIKNKIIKLD